MLLTSTLGVPHLHHSALPKSPLLMLPSRNRPLLLLLLLLLSLCSQQLRKSTQRRQLLLLPLLNQHRRLLQWAMTRCRGREGGGLTGLMREQGLVVDTPTMIRPTTVRSRFACPRAIQRAFLVGARAYYERQLERL
jgi:hypothetical protein